MVRSLELCFDPRQEVLAADKHWDEYPLRDMAEKLPLMFICQLITRFGPEMLIKAKFVERWLARQNWGETDKDRWINFSDYAQHKRNRISEIIIVIMGIRAGREALAKAGLIAQDSVTARDDDQDDQDDQDLPVDNNAQPVPLEGDNNKDNHVGGEKGCRAVPSARLFPIPSSSSSSHCRSEAERLGKIRAHVTRTALSFAFGIRAGWQASIRPCPATTVGCLEIGYQRWVACATMLHPSWSAADYSWFEALDPDSYRLCEDGEARGSLWCPDPTCTNYYRYLERPLVRKCAGASVFDYFDNNGIKWTPSWRIRGKLVTTVKGARIEQKRVAKELGIPSTTSPKVILHLSVRRERLWKWCGRKVRALFCTK